METLVINEVRAYLAYRKLGYKLSFWRNYDGAEVDLVCETRTGFVAIEMKAARQWQPRFGRGLGLFLKAAPPGSVKTVGIFRGERRVNIEGISVLPLDDFLTALWRDGVIT